MYGTVGQARPAKPGARARIVKLPDVAPKLLELDFEPAGWGPAKLSAFLAEQLELTKKLVASGRIKL